jgi:heme/copper-type cytochrome/quinol oxidase subunit 2
MQDQQTNLNSSNSNNSPISFGDWMLTFFVLFIPVVNLVMLAVWALGSSTNPSKANFAKAALVWTLISAVLTFVLVIFAFASFI